MGNGKHAQSITTGGITVALSHGDKVFYPGDGITKADLASYYARAAPLILPLVKDRPLTMIRYPDGIGGERIVQKNIPRYFPDWVSRTEVPKEGGTVCQVLADKPATLVYLASQGCIEPHVPLSRASALQVPDQLVFDLDPAGGNGFGGARRSALWLRELLTQELGLPAYVKTTGGKGLHVHVPLRGSEGFDAVRAFAREAAGLLADRHPDVITTEQRRQQRGGRVYADIMRNAYAQTVIAAYAVRARPGAPVATPLSWEEAADPELTPQRFTLRTMERRLRQAAGAASPWAGMGRHRRGLDRARRQLRALTG